MRLSTAFHGQFYPAERAELEACVDACLAGSTAHGRELLGLVVPHAGYIYSGSTAGRAIGLLRASPPAAVVVLGPSHRVYFEGVRVFELEGYETPLGPLPAEPALAAEIARGLSGDSSHAGFPEHSVEVQLPLLARAVPGVPVVQIVIGAAADDELRRLARVLLDLRERWDFVVLASSDLSHFHSRGEATQLDRRFAELLGSGDRQALREALEGGQVEACGAGGVLTLMEMANATGADLEILERTDSSVTSGDESQVVGYLAAAAWLDGVDP